MDYLINGKGEQVLKEYIKDDDQKRNQLVEDVFFEIETLEKEMEEKKNIILNKIKKFYMDMAKSKRIRLQGDQILSNMILKSYDETKEVKVYQNDLITVPDEQLKLAEECFKNYIKKMKAEGKLINEIELIINKVFSFDRKSGISKTRVLDLLSIQIMDKEWAKGIKIIRDAIQTTGTKEYINFRRREAIGKPLETINLNFSSI